MLLWVRQPSGLNAEPQQHAESSREQCIHGQGQGSLRKTDVMAELERAPAFCQRSLPGGEVPHLVFCPTLINRRSQSIFPGAEYLGQRSSQCIQELLPPYGNQEEKKYIPLKNETGTHSRILSRVGHSLIYIFKGFLPSAPPDPLFTLFWLRAPR